MWLKQKLWNTSKIAAGASVGILMALPLQVSAATAINKIPNPSPGANSYGLEATKTQPPPTQGATISIPGSGSSFSTSPTTVSGLCPTGLLVEVYDNGVMVGSTMCSGGSFTMQVTLFNGQNDLTVSVYDSLDQSGPDSNSVTVNYNNANFSAFGQLVTLTSNYGRRAADPGQTLNWPLLLSGGSGPYAFSIDWGDGSPADLKSQASAGTVTISHVYNNSGVYHVTVKVTDANGVSAFLQLVAISNGNAGSGGGAGSGSSSKATPAATKVVWAPGVISVIFLLPAFWLGRRSKLYSLHRRIERDTAKYKEL